MTINSRDMGWADSARKFAPSLPKSIINSLVQPRRVATITSLPNGVFVNDMTIHRGKTISQIADKLDRTGCDYQFSDEIINSAESAVSDLSGALKSRNALGHAELLFRTYLQHLEDYRKEANFANSINLIIHHPSMWTLDKKESSGIITVSAAHTSDISHSVDIKGDIITHRVRISPKNNHKTNITMSSGTYEEAVIALAGELLDVYGDCVTEDNNHNE